ncbi:PKD-like domain-containing protein [Algoriphagus sp. C2-6-M1]|uniref:PKD-like domain-containing protein n=1 Tax=Algoriphagus persicinus TaxID=3108754 RepID=UPI002B3FE1D3|nr:PKD-like domain-containing protein [Algoriphagus sp. C2-6-M1]MEB2780318.1 PKD-like domain-containing protein [Algoriphagus sp. C2-6-M1]
MKRQLPIILFLFFLTLISLEFYGMTAERDFASLEPISKLFKPKIRKVIKPNQSQQIQVEKKENLRVEEVLACTITLLTSGTGTNNQTVCEQENIVNITYGIVNAQTVTVTGLPPGITFNYSADTLTINGNPDANSASGSPFTFKIEASGGSCSEIQTETGTINVDPLPIVTNTTLNQTICSGSSTSQVALTSDVTGTTFAWTASATTGVSGFTQSGSGPIPTQTISTTGTTQGTVTYVITPTANGCTGPTTDYTVLVNPLATVEPTSAVDNYPTVCFDPDQDPNTPPPSLTFTQQTTGVSSIGTPVGLPAGFTASFDNTSGLITISGTPTNATIGAQPYSIPLNGTCINGLEATGTIDVTPNYELTFVTSASATTVGGSATITINGDPSILSNGTYEIFYQIAQGSGSFTTYGPIDVSVKNGKGSFNTIPINSIENTYVVQILSIKKETDVCTITFSDPATTYFGVCSAVFDANSTFYVPANVYSVTIEVYGGGGGGGKNGGGGGGGAYSIRKNIPVTPGKPIGVFVGQGGGEDSPGGTTYATKNSNIADQIGNSLVYARGGNNDGQGVGGTFDPRYSGFNGLNANGSNGGEGGGPLGGDGGANKENGKSPSGGGGGWSGVNGVGGKGLVVISYSCPDVDSTDCMKFIDDGSKSGFTVIEFDRDCNWIAPDGLAEFTVYVGSGGGGGGGGEGSGGGGSGTLISQTFTTSNPNGLPAGTSFGIGVGNGGNGAIDVDLPGGDGKASTFTGNIDGDAITISVPGGGGGGSSQRNPGGNGASGGGGGASPEPAKSEGLGGNPTAITYTGPNVFIYQGNEGGNGDYSEPQNSVAGGGGGGLTPWKPGGNDGQHGKAAGQGQGEGGRGGDGIVLTLGDSIRYYGAGGGGIGRFFNGTDKIGSGGSAGEVKIGGDGNLTVPNPVGFLGMDKTGSGGGAGYDGGGRGGNGVVYIVYLNFRILGVEYFYFDASYDSENRTGNLSWATTSEWENSHFEIERSVNGVTSWNKIGEIDGKGYSETTSQYKFIDTKLPAYGGVVYYRLKQVDFDDSFSYSVTKSIKVDRMKGNRSWIGYPNPSSKKTSVTIDLLNRSVYKEEPILIQISDVRGVSETYTVNKVEAVSEVVDAYLNRSIPGAYILQLIWGNKSQQIKLLRE